MTPKVGLYRDSTRFRWCIPVYLRVGGALPALVEVEKRFDNDYFFPGAVCGTMYSVVFARGEEGIKHNDKLASVIKAPRNSKVSNWSLCLDHLRCNRSVPTEKQKKRTLCDVPGARGRSTAKAA